MRPLLPALVATLACASAQAELTATEMRWLRAAAPVLAYAQTERLPVDVVVQPETPPGSAPLAMGYVDGRCKLVLTMRGNPQAEAAVAGVPPALVPVVIEAMAAHEVGHCWRSVQGAWQAPPADAGGDRTKWAEEMRATRREEAFADLVGLAWTLRSHPERYAEVHAWLEGVRADQPMDGAHHDTRAWVRLARDRAALAAGQTPFEQAEALWRQGLAGEAD